MSCCTRFLALILIAVDFICMLYFIISNSVNYNKYKQRDNFIIQSRQNYENETIGYYITKQNFSISDCSNGSLFSFEVQNIFNYVVCKRCGVSNVLFESVFVIAVLLNCLTMGLEVFASCKMCLNGSQNWQILGCGAPCLSKVCSFALILIIKIVRQASFIIPTYFIGLFDYDRPCLSYRSYWSLVHLQHPKISLILTIWSILCLIGGLRFTITHVKSSCQFFCLYIVFAIPTIVYGSTVWFTSMFEEKLKINGIVIVVDSVISLLLYFFNRIFGDIGDVGSL